MIFSCVCGATDCPSCGPAQGYTVIFSHNPETGKREYHNPEPEDDEIEGLDSEESEIEVYEDDISDS